MGSSSKFKLLNVEIGLFKPKQYPRTRETQIASFERLKNVEQAEVRVIIRCRDVIKLKIQAFKPNQSSKSSFFVFLRVFTSLIMSMKSLLFWIKNHHAKTNH